MLKVKFSALFKKDYKRIQKRHYDVKALEDVIHLLAVTVQPLFQLFKRK